MAARTFSYYRRELGWLAILTLPCRLLDLLEQKEDRIRHLESMLGARDSRYNSEVDTLRKEFTDREIARLGFKPIYQKETPPQVNVPQRSQVSMIDRARKELIGQPAQTARTAADRAENLQDSLKKIQENGAADTAN